jgi:lipid A 3-O-deacylase
LTHFRIGVSAQDGVFPVPDPVLTVLSFRPRPVLAAAACLLFAGRGGAQVQVVIDNDLFGLRGADAAPPDYEYTHGTAVSWDGSAGTRWEVGQRIYTPRHDAAEPVPGERPYAGWLYGAWERTSASGRTRARLRVEAGVTGPPSLAEPVQNGLHRLAGYRPQLGWEHQLGFEPGIVVSYGREHRLVAVGRDGARRLDVLPSWAVRAGNVRTSADAGLRARLGLGAGNAWTGAGAAGGWSGWIEAGGRQEAVLRDLFLDGNTFGGRDTGVRRRTWVAQGEAAFGVRYRRTELEYRFVLRGREYETQEEPHPYGSIRLRIW